MRERGENQGYLNSPRQILGQFWSLNGQLDELTDHISKLMEPY